MPARWPDGSGVRTSAAPRSSPCALTASTTSAGPSRPCATSARPANPPRRCARPRASASGRSATILANTPPQTRDADKPWWLAPVDLQAIKAAGVTFATSMLERVIEERARGDRERGRAPARRNDETDRRRPEDAEARLARRPEAEGGADRGGRLVAISRGRHRPGRGDLHQVAADVGGRLGRRGRLPLAFGLEQPGARGGDLRRLQRRDRRRERSATTSTCAISRAAARCCSARRRTRTRAARSARSCACSTRASRSTTCARCRFR